MTRSRRHALLALLALALLAALLAACGDDEGGTASSGEAPSAELILDWFPNADHAGVYAAIREGFFERAGVRVTATVPSDPAASLKAVASGRAPFAISYEPEVLLARSQGIPVKAVGAIVTNPLNAVIAREDRGIARPRDLEGRTVGMAGLPSDRPLLDTVVRADGGDPSKVRTRVVGFTLGPALAAGRVDALFGAYWNVEAVQIEQMGTPVRVFRLEDFGVPEYDELVVVTSVAFAAERPEVVRAFLDGLAQGQRWAVDNQAAAVEHLVTVNRELDRALATEGVRLVAPLLVPADGPVLGVDPAAWASYAEWMRGEGLLEKPLDPADAVTDEFLPTGAG